MCRLTDRLRNDAALTTSRPLFCCDLTTTTTPSHASPQAHRLKNDATLTNRALDSLACRRRVLLSGTPLQNRLDEFYGGRLGGWVAGWLVCIP